MKMESITRTVEKMIETLAEEICDKYCKYPDQWDEEAEGCELCESEICRNCPLTKQL